MRGTRVALPLFVLAPTIRSIPLPPVLTDAERFVATALVRGASLRAIALSRGTSHRTVANQSRAIYRKLGVRCRLELVMLLREPRRSELDLSLLDERERMVFSLRANAKAIKEIAIDLRMSPATVCRTLSRAMSKLGLESTTDVVRLGY